MTRIPSVARLVPQELDLVPGQNFSISFSSWESLVPELVPELKSGSWFSTSAK